MCVVSMVMDHQHHWWEQRPIPQPTYPPVQPNYPIVFPLPAPQITQQELDEFRSLLERARQYDKEHNEPECELDEKKQKLRDLAKQLGVEINFL